MIAIEGWHLIKLKLQEYFGQTASQIKQPLRSLQFQTRTSDINFLQKFVNICNDNYIAEKYS